MPGPGRAVEDPTKMQDYVTVSAATVSLTTMSIDHRKEKQELQETMVTLSGKSSSRRNYIGGKQRVLGGPRHATLAPFRRGPWSEGRIRTQSAPRRKHPIDPATYAHRHTLSAI